MFVYQRVLDMDFAEARVQQNLLDNEVPVKIASIIGYPSFLVKPIRGLRMVDVIPLWYIG